MRLIIIIFFILIVTNALRFLVIRQLEKKRDNVNLYSTRGKILIKHYNRQIDILRFRNVFTRTK